METKPSKYAPLRRHLSTLNVCRWPASFVDIEHILGFCLPKSARTHRQWWQNQSKDDGRHARAWQAAGWQTSTVDLRAQTLVFERLRPPPPQRPASLGDGSTMPCSAASRRPSRTTETMYADSAARTVTFGGQAFEHFAPIAPEAGPDGKPMEYMPQHRYREAQSTPLNRYGQGPFCRFAVPGLPAAQGVYVITVAQKLVYVGIATNLRQRWGSSGYARIQPRNCFKAGQSTNCKVNHAILSAARGRLAIDLWIHQTGNPRPLEARLIGRLAPPWNGQR